MRVSKARERPVIASPCVKSCASSYNGALDVTACKSEDGKVVSLRVINLDFRPVVTRIRLRSFRPVRSAIRLERIEGELEARNTPEHPRAIVPTRTEIRPEMQNGTFEHTFGPYSFTILDLE